MPDNYSSITSFQNGRYSVIKKLGEGGKGIVFKCQDNTLGRVVAIKLIKGDALDAETYSRLMREAQTTAKLSHPNIMSIYDLISEDARFLMVIEYVEGKTLDSYISDSGGKLSIQEVLRISAELCDALQYAHARGILHRDIKPENIMIDRNGVPKLMDFGLAKSFDSPGLTHAGTIVGTPAYLSPESALGKEADARSDLYSLGCVIYQMVTGVPPFRSDDTLKLIYSHIHDTPAPPISLNPSVPKQINAIIMKLISKNPGDRFQTAKELNEALKSIRSIISGDGNDSMSREIRADNSASISQVSILSQGSLIGMEGHIAKLREIVDLSVMGQGRSAMILGDTGLGKTRLSSEVKDYAVLRGMRSITIKCRENRKNIPHYVFSEILRDYLYNSPQSLIYKICGDYGDVAVKLFPELESRLGRISPPLNQDPEYLKARFQEGAVQIMLNISTELPLCLIIEDCQFADSASIGILKALSDRISNIRMALILTGNKSDLESKLLLEDLESTRNFLELELNPLDREGTKKFISSYLSEPVQNISSQFLDFIYGRTGGNPLYTEEVLKFLIDKKIIFKSATGSWDRKPIENAGVPGSLVGLIRERLSGIDEYSTNLLINGSIIGIEFDVDVLSELLGDTSDKFYDSLERLMQRGILREKQTFTGGIKLFFSNPQVYYYFLDQFSLLKKRRLHQKIAEIMANRTKGADISTFSEIATHFVEGGQPEKAVSYFLKIGDSWRESYNGEAALQRYYEVYTILKGLSQNGQEEKYAGEMGEVCLKICGTKALSGLGENFEEYWNSGMNAFHLANDLKGQAKMLIFAGFAGNQNNYMDRADRFIREHGEEKGLDRLIAELGFTIASRSWYTNDLENARKYYIWTKKYISEHGIASEYDLILDRYSGSVLREIRSQEDIDWVMSVFEGKTTNVPENFNYKDSVIASEIIGFSPNSRWTGVYYDFFANHYISLKMNLSSAEETFKKGLDLYGKNFGYGYVRLYLSEYLQMVLGPSGRWEEADRIVDQYSILGLEIVNDLYSRHSASMVSLYKALKSLYSGPDPEDTERIRGAIDKLAYQFLSHSNDLIQRLYLETGNKEKAIEYTESVLEKLSKVPVTVDVFPASIIVRSCAVEVYALAGNKDRAMAILKDLGEITSKFKEKWIKAFMKYAEAEYESVFGDLSKSIESMEYAVSFFREAGYHVRYAASSLQLAQIYQKKGDRAKGSANVSNAIEIFTKLDCPHYVKKCLGLMDLLNA